MGESIGSSFDSFLEEEGLLVEASAEELKRVLSWQMQGFLESNRFSHSKEFLLKFKHC